MKHLKLTLFLSSLLAGAAAPLAAQDAEPAAVPALESGVNLQIVLTTTTDEASSGPAEATVLSADFDITRMNTKAFVELLDEKYDLVEQPKDFTLVAVLVETETENGYRFYLKNTKKNGTPAYVYLDPEIIGLAIEASASKYREVQNGETLVSGSGKFKHAIALDSAGFSTRGVATGGYKIKNVTVDEVTSQLSVPSAMKFTTSGSFVEGAETPEEKTYIAETRWTFSAGKAVDLNDYPAPPAPEIL
jgi:hypothetical protein